MNKMGGLSGIMGIFLGMSGLKNKMEFGVNEEMLKKQIAVIDSMTKSERTNPKILHRVKKELHKVQEHLCRM